MAAAEYFASGTRPPYEQSNSLRPPQQPQRAHSQPGYTYHPPQLALQHMQYPPPPPPPPPYQPLADEPKLNVHSGSAPSVSSQHRPSLPTPSRPEPYMMNLSHYHTQQTGPYQPGPLAPQAYAFQQQPHIQQPYWPGPNYSAVDLAAGNGYSSDPERRRRKHKSRPRRISDNSRSTDADGFLGAAGGGLLGDLLFPGLGTVGGALVGWVGGKDYGKHRKWREDKRDRDQERWERKFRRSRSRSDSRGRRSSHDRRKS